MNWFVMRVLAILAAVLLGTVGLAEAKTRLESRFAMTEGKPSVVTERIDASGRKKVDSITYLPAEIAAKYAHKFNLKPVKKTDPASKPSPAKTRISCAVSPAPQAPVNVQVVPAPASAAAKETSEVKSPLINNVRDAYSVKRPTAKEITVVVGKVPASYLKFAKGLNIGTVAVGSKKTVRGTTIAAGADNRMGQALSLSIFEEQFDPDSMIFCSDRWYNNSIFDDKRGETVIFNLSGWHGKLAGGMFLKNDKKYIDLIAQTHGTPAKDVLAWTIQIQKLDQVIRVVLRKKLQTPDGVRYTSVDIPIFKKLYAQPALTSFIGRFLNNGGIAIGIPPELIGTLTNIIVAAVTAAIDTRHNIPCLSTLKGGIERFERDQKFYESGGALYSGDFDRAKAQEKRVWNAALQRGTSGALLGQPGVTGGVEDILAVIQPVSPTGYPQAYNWPGFWLVPKRVEWPSGGGMSQGPQLQVKYAFSNTYLHLFGGEVAPNATFHWGPSTKLDFWRYGTSSGYRGRGHFFGLGETNELVTSHSWGGTDNRFAVWYGLEQLDKGQYHHDRRHPWMVEWQTEIWLTRLGLKLGKDGKYGSMFDGAKMGILAKTNDSVLAWLFPVIYRAPYDAGKISAGLQFLGFFSRDGDEPKGGGAGLQIEVLDGLGGRLSYFPFKEAAYLTGWVDSYQIWRKIQELRAEFGIYEISWDQYVPEVRPAAAAVLMPQPKAAPKLTRPTLPALKCASKKQKKMKRAVKKRFGKAVIKKKGGKSKLPPHLPNQPAKPKPKMKNPIKGQQECWADLPEAMILAAPKKLALPKAM